MEKFEFTVDNVYDLAADIGKEFEVLIDSLGVEAVTNLMTKVICALEHLEACTVFRENAEADVADLRANIAQLEYEKMEKEEYRHKIDQDLEVIEDSWRKQNDELSELVSRLKEENYRLNNSLEDKLNYFPEKCHSCLVEQDVKVVQKLKEVMRKQQEQIKSQEKEILTKTTENENLQQQTDKLSQLNKDMRWRVKKFQSQIHSLVGEKSDLQVQVQDQQRQLASLKKSLSEAIKENIDLTSTESTQMLDLRGKIIINADDPNRPRFTLDELRHILFERNDLKARISDLEDELSMYKPKISRAEVALPADDELPVQGPINREPDDKLYPSGRKSIGIHKFFKSFRRFSK